MFIKLATAFQANSQSYDLENAPWSDESFEVCPVPSLNGLRSIIFEPVLETGKTFIPKQSSKLYSQFDEETGELQIIEKMINVPAEFIFLKEQFVGFIDQNNRWVDENGNPATSKMSFQKHTGDKDLGTMPIWPDVKPLPGKNAYERHDSAVKRGKDILAKMPDCTTFMDSGFGVVSETILNDYGPNNPRVCSPAGGHEIGEQLNSLRTINRRVVELTDGGFYLARIPGGEIKSFGSIQIELFVNLIAQHSSCEWTSAEERVSEP